MTEFASFESLVPSGEARQAVIAIVSVLATPGKAKLRVLWPKYAMVFFLYCAALPALTEWLLLRPPAYAIAFVVLVLAREALAWVIQRRLARDGSLVFEDRAPAYITRLELET